MPSSGPAPPGPSKVPGAGPPRARGACGHGRVTALPRARGAVVGSPALTERLRRSWRPALSSTFSSRARRRPRPRQARRGRQAPRSRVRLGISLDDAAAALQRGSHGRGRLGDGCGGLGYRSHHHHPRSGPYEVADGCGVDVLSVGPIHLARRVGRQEGSLLMEGGQLVSHGRDPFPTAGSREGLSAGPVARKEGGPPARRRRRARAWRHRTCARATSRR